MYKINYTRARKAVIDYRQYDISRRYFHLAADNIMNEEQKPRVPFINNPRV